MENRTKESGSKNFNMKVWFYDNWIDEETGEVFQKEFVYVGALQKRKLYARGIRIEDELDVLLYILHRIQEKCETVICYDNNKPLGSPMREVFRIHHGEIIRERKITSSVGKSTIKIYRLDHYQTFIKRFIPKYLIIPHNRKKAA